MIDPASATPEQVRDELQTVTDPRRLHLLVLAICTRTDLAHAWVTDPATFRRPLTSFVPAARKRCNQTGPSS